MEPFHVICETCHARLKVRSASAIGEIHACPRCESMVLIVPPAGLTAMGIGCDSRRTAGHPQAATHAEPFTHVAAPSVEAADAFAAAAEAALAGGSLGGAPGALHPSASAAPAVSPALATGLKEVAVMLLQRPIVLVGAGVAVLVLVGGLAIALWPSREDASGDAPPPAVAQAAPSIDVAARAAEADARNTAEQAASSVEDDRGSADAVPDPLIASVDPPTLPELPDLPPARATADDAGRSADAGTARPEDTAASSSETPTAHVEPARPPVFRIDPLDFDPSHLTLSGGSRPATDSTGVSSTSITPDTGDAAQIPIANDAPPASADDDPTISVRRGPPSTDPIRRDATAQLSLPIQSLNMQAVPLVRLIALVSDMADVPITLDPSALEMIGKSPQLPVTVDVKDTTLEQMLRDTLAQQGMELIDSDGFATVVRPAGDEMQPREIDVQDLLPAGATDATQLADWVQRFVAPDAWQPRGGAGTMTVEGAKLRVEQSIPVHIGCLLFCERLRAARGLPIQSRYPAARLRVDSPYARLAAQLDQPTTFTFLPWTRFAEVVRHWQQTSGVTMLVDWRALGQIELASSSPVSCSAIRRTWRDALDAILKPLGLAWWAVDGETIQITTRDALRTRRQLEFYPVAATLRQQFADTAALVAALRQELHDNVGIDGANDAPQVETAFDAPSARLIVLGNADVHRYLTDRLSGADN